MSPAEILLLSIEVFVAGVLVSIAFGAVSHFRWKRARREALRRSQEDEALRLANWREENA
jgi:hypothetical protein